MVTITTVSGEADITGRISVSSIAAPPINASTSVRTNAGQWELLHQAPGDERAEHRHLALREVDDAGGAVDQHEGEREARVDPAGGEPRDDLLEELFHQ